MADVVGHHAVGAESPGQRADRVHHPLDPMPREPVDIAIVIKRNDFFGKRLLEVMAVAFVGNAVIDVRLPPDVTTVEEAAHYLLRRSGFNLLPPDPGDQPVNYLLSQPLPEVHRHLGPISLREALLTLGGKAFLVNVDYVYRKVGYHVSPAYAEGRRS